MSVAGNILKDMANQGTEKIGLFYSVYRGIVLHNEDPNKLGGIKVMVPGVIEEDTGYWASPIGNFAGKGYGLHIIPAIGSVVYVMFEMGDPSKPLWFHGYFGEGDIPEGYDDPDHFWLVTPGGASVEINDVTGEVLVTDHHGNSIELNSTGISIDVKSSKKKIFLGDVNKADEPAVLGDTLEKLLKELIDNQVAINNLIKDLGDATMDTIRDIGMASMGPVQGGTMTGRVATMAAQMSATYSVLSAKNKSIMATYNNLKDFKSQTVKLDK